ncbi:hypothetical protein [Pseudidiomarina salinarum]|uniref:hypothetical protein n=1 Tax=Pseudidiomarina salinarum TaxID=435908 RepID=UPI00068E13FD|nr:hypothetical protein [Pseudidiomarina salinarum]RUO68569.1 hypothetical protein CWI79_10860 [Pseudidiomarina salinarum]
MSTSTDTSKLDQARELMQGFAERTGLANDSGDAARRYLWTDAFATLNFLALKRIDNDKAFEARALRTIKEVHCHLGQYAEKDSRDGWISGLEGEKAREHPTVGGLRIGKKMLERQEDERYDQNLEWERDGQYYHYHTRWINALLTASKHFDNEQLATWAAELSIAGSRFIADKEGAGTKMYWKMSVDLSRPLVPMMGAHDPLEGLLCAMQAYDETGSFKYEFDGYIEKLKELCARSHWATDDALGVGSLLLNVVRATELQAFMELPPAVKPERLLRDAEQGLESIYRSFDANESARYRLAFRECGLSLGLRCLKGNLAFLKENAVEPQIDSPIWQMAEDIEAFWLDEQNQQAPTFQNHLDINEVSLAASILAQAKPEIYTRV